jgi:hypothetical protein
MPRSFCHLFPFSQSMPMGERGGGGQTRLRSISLFFVIAYPSLRARLLCAAMSKCFKSRFHLFYFCHCSDSFGVGLVYAAPCTNVLCVSVSTGTPLFFFPISLSLEYARTNSQRAILSQGSRSKTVGHPRMSPDLIQTKSIFWIQKQHSL